MGPTPRARRSVALASILFLAASLLLPSAASQWARYEAPGANHYAGYLTMNGGKGGIAWTAGAKTDDPGGSAGDPATDAQLLVGYTASTGGRDQLGPVPPVDEFISDPLPTTLHIDPGHQILLELRLTGYQSNGYYDPCYYKQSSVPGDIFNLFGGSDPRLNVELLIGTERVGGLYGAAFIDWWSVPGGRPADPPGFAACRFVFHPEVPTLPAGTILKLRIEHLAQSQKFRYGLAGEHASVLYIPFFSPEEWLFRDPGRAAPSTTGAGAAPPSTGSAAASMGAIGLLGLLAFAVPARQPGKRAVLVALVFFAASLAGCIGGAGDHATGDGPAPTGGTAVQTIVKDENGTLTKGVNGSIIGEVHDDLNLPLKGVHVGVLGTNFFAESGPQGQFKIPSLAPSVYQVRFDYSGYRSLEIPVTVQTQSATRLSVQLVPLVERAANDRPHVHDHWEGQPTKVIMDANLPYTCTVPGTSCSPAYAFTLPSPKDGEVSSILPGTYETQVVVKWDQKQIPYQRVTLNFRANNEPSTWNASHLAPRASGVPFRIQTSWEMDDPGHQDWSTWNFGIQPVYDEPSSTPDVFGPAPAYHVTITLHRGVVPVEPAHPDRWMGNTSFVAGKIPYSLYHSPFNAAFGPLILGLCKGLNQPCTANVAYYGRPQSIIPVETTWLEVYLNQTADTVPHHDWLLKFRPAGATYGDYEYAKFSTAPASISKTAFSTKWRVPVKPDEVDPYYNTKSAWYFLGWPADETMATLDYSNPAQASITTTLTVIAHKGPMP